MEKQQDNEYPKHGVGPTDPETMDYEDQTNQGNLNFFDEPDPFFSSDYTITSD